MALQARPHAAPLLAVGAAGLLGWTLQSAPPPSGWPAADRVAVALFLCASAAAALVVLAERARRQRRLGEAAVWDAARVRAPAARNVAPAPDTEPRQAPAQLEASLAALVKASTDAIVTVTPQGRIASWNPAAERIYGVAAREAIGQDACALLSPGLGDARRELDTALGGESLAGLERGVLRPDGAPLDLIFQLEPIRDAAGVITGVLYTVRDVTAELRARRQLEAASGRIDRIHRIADAMLSELPLDSLLTTVLDRLREALPLDSASILIPEADEGDVSQPVLRVRAVVGVEEDHTLRAMRIPVDRGFTGRVAREGRPLVWNDADPERLVDPRVFPQGRFSVAGIPMISGNRLIGVLNACTLGSRGFEPDELELLQLAAERIALGIERAARQEAERRAKDLAEAASRSKDEFLAMLGHELRNPLSAARSAVATASADPQQQERALEIAGRQLEQLGRLIDDLLDVARVTQGRITLRREPARLEQIVERAVEGVLPLMERRAHRLRVALGAEGVSLEVDAARLEQTVVNLLSNAAKYTHPGGEIEVAVELQDAEALIRVRDNGIGISAGMLPRVFDLFSQGERALDRSDGGLGVGLAVARRVVEMHGGRIEARSDGAGRGSEFVVCLPLALAAQTAPAVAAPAPPAQPRSQRVLVVEDNPDAAESLGMLVGVFGHRVDVADRAAAALELARARPPDAMLIDIGLPGMDGYELARRIRSDPALRGAVLIALTGYALEDDRRRALEVGFDYHLPKPVDPDALRELLERLPRAGLSGPAGLA
jgi:PAS domain S-box-containing protein